MLAELSHEVPSGPGWSFELKWDGMRACISIGPSRELKIFSRRGNDYTQCFPELHDVASHLPPGIILDGEIAVLDEQGRPDFDRIQDRWHRPIPAVAAALARTNPVTFVAFDVLWCDGRKLQHEAYQHRREQLHELNFRGPRWLSPADHRSDGNALRRLPLPRSRRHRRKENHFPLPPRHTLQRLAENQKLPNGSVHRRRMDPNLHRKPRSTTRRPTG